MDETTLEVSGFQLKRSDARKRSVRLDLRIKGGETLSVDLELPVITRLTDQLIDVEDHVAL